MSILNSVDRNDWHLDQPAAHDKHSNVTATVGQLLQYAIELEQQIELMQDGSDARNVLIQASNIIRNKNQLLDQLEAENKALHRQLLTAA